MPSTRPRTVELPLPRVRGHLQTNVHDRASHTCYDSTGCRLVSVPYPCMTARCALFAFSSEGAAVTGEAQLYILQHVILVIYVRCCSVGLLFRGCGGVGRSPIIRLATHYAGHNCALFSVLDTQGDGVKPSYTIGLPVEYARPVE